MDATPYKALLGTTLKGTYRVERLLGQGGMGAVFAASHMRMSRPFAIKVLSPQAAEVPEAVARFQREAEVTSRLGHPNIVEVFDFDHTEAGAPYIVMELLEGEDLGDRLQRAGRLDLEPAVAIVDQVGHALGSAHAKGIVHRDLKPQNLFLCRLQDGRTDFLKVVDFGISKVLDSNTELTRTSVLIGSPYYMSPEQADERAAEVDQRTDVYATGAILYQMLAGHPPLTARSVPTLLYKIVHEPPPPLREVRPEISPAVEAVVSRALNKAPDDRFGSMQAMLEALGAAVQGAGVDALDETILPRATSAEVTPAAPAPGKSTVWIAVAALFALLAGGGVVAMLYLKGPTPGGGAAVVDQGVITHTASQADTATAVAMTRADAAVQVDATAQTAAAQSDAGRATRQSVVKRPNQRTAVLQVQTLHEGRGRPAEIFLDDRRVGESPLYLRNLAPGRHVIRAERQGFRPASARVRLLPGKRKSVVLGLQPSR